MKKVFAFFDEAVEMWVAHSDDIPGLNTEADTFDLLRDRIKAQAVDLMACNRAQLIDLSPDYEIVVRDGVAPNSA